MDEPAVVTPPHLGRPLRLHPFHGLTLAPRWIGTPTSGRTFARPYRDVTRRLRRGESTGRVTRDAEPGLYLHQYAAAGTRVRGLVGAMDLTTRSEPLADRAVLPHEGVRRRQVEDLADRMREMSLNPAPILLVHRGPEPLRRLLRSVIERPPTRAFLDHGGTEHQLWALRDAGELEMIAAELAGTSPVIADGHHRYAAYLRLQEQRPGTGWDRGLTMLVDQDDTPLRLGAIHRVVPRLRWEDLEPLADACPGARWQSLVGAEARQALREQDDAGSDVVVTDGGSRWATWHLPHPPGVATVELLHRSVVPLLPRRRLRYHHSVEQAVASARATSGIALLLPTPSFDLVHEAVAHDRLLPEKATSFQPKPAVGVLMREVRDG